MSPTLDFVVIGGGPAGAAFATLAARAGASVALVERDDYEGLRPGEHLAGRVRPILDLLGVSKTDAAGIVAASPGIVATWDTDASVLKTYNVLRRAPGLCVTRHRFDELLCRTARAAGAAVVLRGRPRLIERRADGRWVMTVTRSGRERMDELTATTLVDASGRSAGVVRSQGGRRLHHGDLVAIVRWLDTGSGLSRFGDCLSVESCAQGWWSLSGLGNGTLVATLYTSLAMMRAARATPERWWGQALIASDRIRDLIDDSDATGGPTRLYRACPSRSSRFVGRGWIAVGDAAIALDPLGGQGVALALESACRAFEAAQVDPSFEQLGREYRDALLSRFHDHLEGRADAYGAAAAILSPAFVDAAVAPGAPDVG